MAISTTDIEAIRTELVAAGIDGSLCEAMLEAIETAGYQVEPAGGGTPITVSDEVPCLVKKVAGRPGVTVHQVGGSSGPMMTWVEVRRAGAQTVIVPATATSSAVSET